MKTPAEYILLVPWLAIKISEIADISEATINKYLNWWFITENSKFEILFWLIKLKIFRIWEYSFKELFDKD